MALCPYCAAELETPLCCGACKRPLEADEIATPFAVLGLAPTFEVDVKDVRRRLTRTSRDIHPDFFGTASVAEQQLAERNSARLNKAFDILSDDAARADWLVRSLGGPDEQAERAMPREFLMEVLEWNEVLEEARANKSQVDARLDPLESALRARREAAIASVRKLLVPLPPSGSSALKSVRQELNAVRYIDRALDEIETLRLARATTH